MSTHKIPEYKPDAKQGFLYQFDPIKFEDDVFISAETLQFFKKISLISDHNLLLSSIKFTSFPIELDSSFQNNVLRYFIENFSLHDFIWKSQGEIFPEELKISLKYVIVMSYLKPEMTVISHLESIQVLNIFKNIIESKNHLILLLLLLLLVLLVQVMIVFLYY